MAVKIFLIFVTLLAYVEFLGASPTRRQLITITEATASDSPVTNEGALWDDNDEFDLDGQDWYSQPVALPSAIPVKTRDYNDYEEDYNNRANDNVVADFANNDDDDDEGDVLQEQDAEEDEDEANSRNDSEFLFVPPRDTRLMLQDDDDDQSGPIKVRHTGRSSYPRVSNGNDNSLEADDEDKDENEHPYEFAIDEDDKDDDDDDDDDDGHNNNNNSMETLPRHDVHEDEDDEDDFISEGEDGDMFENPEEDAAQVIYGDHVFLY